MPCLSQRYSSESQVTPHSRTHSNGIYRSNQKPNGPNSFCSSSRSNSHPTEPTTYSTTYQDPSGKTRTWEHAERRTRPADSEIDGVGIVAIISKPDGNEIVLEKQFRPPLDKVVIEVPAGLVDEGETPEQAAVRELKEETGYVGVVEESTPIMFNGKYTFSRNFRIGVWLIVTF